MKQLSVLIFLTCIFIMTLSSCAEDMPVVSSQTPTSSSTPPSTIGMTAIPTLNYKKVILTPDDVFSLPEIPAWSTPNSEDFCENLPIPQVIATPNNVSVLAGKFVLCIYERSFTAIDLDTGRLVSTDDERGDIVMFTARSWTNENPSYGISSRNKAYLENAYVIMAYANHSGVDNLSYEYCENKLRGKTDVEGMRAELHGIACVKTTEGQIALVRVEKIYPAVTLSVEFSFAILRNE